METLHGFFGYNELRSHSQSEYANDAIIEHVQRQQTKQLDKSELADKTSEGE
jgi:hypothetical protein